MIEDSGDHRDLEKRQRQPGQGCFPLQEDREFSLGKVDFLQSDPAKRGRPSRIVILEG